MKEFRKTKDGLFICEECGITYIRKSDLSYHVDHKHNGTKKYYDKWIKEENDDKCKICGKGVKFKGFYGYSNCCTKQCTKKLREQTTLKKYGVSNTFQSEEKKQKIKETCLLRYGVDHNFKSSEVKKKRKKTWIKNHGVDNPLKSKKIRKQISNTLNKRYGVYYTHQNQEILNKSLKTAKLLKEYKNTGIYYQGTYELDFLEKHYDKYPDIQRGLTIKYNFKGKERAYHPDFYISSLNLIVEIKSTWTYDEIIDPIKERATINSGFKYIMIINKNYNDFNMLFSS